MSRSRRRNVRWSTTAGIDLRPTDVAPGQAPACDAVCKGRWGNRPHIHVKTEGMDDDTPLFTIAIYCSCGFLAEEEECDARDPLRGPSTTRGPEMMQHHFRTRHGFDPMEDKDWQRRAARPS